MRQPYPTLAFSVAFAVLLITPALLGMPFTPYRLLKVGDMTDLLTPLILIPLYWRLYQTAADHLPSTGATLAFLVFAAFWVQGQGMHLAANAIGHLLQEAASSDASALTHFYDETLSHYLWHTGVVGLSAVLLWRAGQHPPKHGQTISWVEILAGMLYGFTYFVIVVEAGTAPLAVPFALLVMLLGLLGRWRRWRQNSTMAFFLVAHAIAVVLFAVWAIYWGGLPEFSAVGLID